ncbi:helix-turn-helix transcriptional regulator [Streptomyces sp. NPDC045470]|uniref:helix-turn-helix domain-containing protein n=1 Tax=Streptomyces sp. NPDC045470 TaxID=3155469 RepID=UPI00340A070C
MARPETPLPIDASRPLLELAQGLRDLRAASNLSYQAMSETVSLSAASLSRTASGQQIPTPEALTAFLTACAVPPDDIDHWQKLRDDAVRAALEPRPWTRGARITHLARSGLLRELHRAAGSPSLRSLHEELGVSKSTLHRVLTAHVDIHGKPPPPPHQILAVADILLRHLPHSQYTRGGPFADVYQLVRPYRTAQRASGRNQDSRRRTRLPDGPSHKPAPADDGDAGLLGLARRTAAVQRRIAAGELTADDDVVRLLAEVQQVLESRAKPAPGQDGATA